MEQKDFVASVFKTFDLKLNTLAERIAFQKTVYLLQKFGSGTNFRFVWHNFGPYSSELARIGFSLNEIDKLNASILDIESSRKLIQIKEGQKGNSKFLEMMSDIIYLYDGKKINEKELFQILINHQSYLNDQDLFKLALQRLRAFNLL